MCVPSLYIPRPIIYAYTVLCPGLLKIMAEPADLRDTVLCPGLLKIMAEPADLRDHRVIRATFLHQLMDWEGNDLKSVYEPISQQVGNLFCFFLVILCCYIAWRKYKRWRIEAKEKLIPYKIIKPPSRLISESGGEKKKRVCAVVGGTGFIGSQVVNELVQRGEYYAPINVLPHLPPCGRMTGNKSEFT